MKNQKVLTPLKFKGKKITLFAFDTETHNKNKDFTLASIIGEDGEFNLFFSREEVQKEFLKPCYRGSWVIATNLYFDFFTVFGYCSERTEFLPTWRGSKLLGMRSFIYNDKFNLQQIKDRCKMFGRVNQIKFIDTLNYAKLSVAELGQCIGLTKGKKPKWLGKKKPETLEEWSELIEYNKRDSEISLKFMRMLIDKINYLKGDVGMTIGSSAMNLYRSKYLPKILDDLSIKGFYVHEDKILDDLFDGYYGGRCEARARGRINKGFMYDFSSLYPSVMREFKFPNPNTHRYTKKDSLEYIREYEGISKVTISIPKGTVYPFLPYRTETKLIFPTGKFTAWESHIELREALKDGAIIEKVHGTHYYTSTITPFKEFIDDLYKLRLEVGKNTPLGMVCKLIMNSFYGKWGQKYKDKDNIVPSKSITFFDTQNKYKKVEPTNEPDFSRVTEDRDIPLFCFPIWALYCTAYGRLKLHKAIVDNEALYYDTDSIITYNKIKTSSQLGFLDFVCEFEEAIIVRPKFYYYFNPNGKEKNQIYICKIKGVNKKLTRKGFFTVLRTRRVRSTKFSQFRESLRTGKYFNEIISCDKTFSLEDSKRTWKNRFSPDVIEWSEPLHIEI